MQSAPMEGAPTDGSGYRGGSIPTDSPVPAAETLPYDSSVPLPSANSVPSTNMPFGMRPPTETPPVGPKASAKRLNGGRTAFKSRWGR